MFTNKFIIDPTTLGGYRRSIKIRRFYRNHIASLRLSEKSKFGNKVESSATVGIFREHLRKENPDAFVNSDGYK